MIPSELEDDPFAEIDSDADRWVPFNTYKYKIPVIADHDGSTLTGQLTVTRDPSGWCGKLLFRPDLFMDMDQVSTPRNGGFWHLTHEQFLHQVRLVFGFEGGADFEFATDDFDPFFADEETSPPWVTDDKES